MIRILLVEDELLVRTGMKSLIDWEAHGFVLAAEASHGKSALDILHREPIDIVVTDIRMPIMDGLELIERIRELALPCEIIVLSSYDDFAYVKKAMQLQVRDYIHKPSMTPEEIMDVLCKVAAGIEARRNADNARQLILETVAESRELMLSKRLQLALSGEPADDPAIRGMLQDEPILDSPFYLAIIRMLPGLAMEPAYESQAELVVEKALREGLSHLHATESRLTAHLLKDDPYWVVVLPDKRQETVLQETELKLLEAKGPQLQWAVSEKSCSLDEAHRLYAELKREANERYEAWLKLRGLHPLIKETLYYIRDHYQSNVTLEAVSSSIHTSPVYLSRLFYKEIGQSFIDYLTRYRVKQAKMLLRHSDLKTYEIADRVGYRNSKYFLRVFRKLTGMTPGEYRSTGGSAPES